MPPMASLVPVLRAMSRYPAWATEDHASRRLRSFCRRAAVLPTTIVATAPAAQIQKGSEPGGRNAKEVPSAGASAAPHQVPRMRMATAKPAAFEATARNPATEVEAP